VKLVIELLIGGVLPPVLVMAWRPVNALMTRWLLHRIYSRRDFVADWIWCASVQAVLFLYSGPDAVGIGAGVSVVVAASIWWWRRKPDRAAGLIGEKSRARLAAIVQRAREVARPRPVLNPQREGAR
jgi:hypothetical protein